MELFFLFLAALVTSTLSGVLGMGGGLVLLSYLAQFYEPAVLIPLHGAVQLASNFSRTYLNREHIDWRIFKLFALGAVVGAAVGSQFVVALPKLTFQLIIGVFILYLVWGPKPKVTAAIPFKFLWVGLVTSFLSLFVGATGPLKAGFFLNETLDKFQVVATKASCQAMLHFFKLIVFFSLGFSFAQYFHEIALMVAAVFLGSWVGRSLLGKLPEKHFKLIFKLLITCLALRMLYLVGLEAWADRL